MYFRSYTCLTELTLVLVILYLHYRTCTCLTDLIRSLFWYKVPIGTTQIHYTKVLVGTTGLISPKGHIFVLISDSYTYTRILIHVLVLITDIYLSNLL